MAISAALRTLMLSKGGSRKFIRPMVWLPSLFTMPDAQTAINALQSGDIDFMEVPPIEMLPILEANPDIKVDTLNKLGNQTMGRMNFLLPPFDNIKVRKAALMAMNQKDVLDALIGNPKYQK